MPLFRLLTKCLLGSSLSLVVITDLEGGRHNPLPYILSYIPLLWLHPISHQGQGKQFVSKQYKAGCAVRLQHLPPAFMDYTKKSFNRATSFLTRKTPFLRKETSWDASERWPPSCRLQNVFIYFLEIQVIPEVEHRTIKLLSNKGHLPPTTSIKMLRDAPGSVQADIYQGRGTLSTATQPAPVMSTSGACSCHAYTSFWGKTEILWPQMQRRNVLLCLRKVQWGKCCWNAVPSTHQLSWWWDTPQARATNLFIF